MFVNMKETIGNTFDKAERLCSKNRFERLLSSGSSFISYPLRVVICEADREEEEYPAQIAISVAKKRFKRAVKRNRIKRLIREAYRLNKFKLYERIPRDKRWDILFIYLGDTVVEYVKIEKAIAGVFRKMEKYIEESRDRHTVDSH